MNVELEQNKVDLIKKSILSNKKYMDNEDLYEDFFEETYKRSFLIIKTVSNSSSLETYLNKIAATSIINVLKNVGRGSKGHAGLDVEKLSAVSAPAEIQSNEAKTNYADIEINYDMIDVDDSSESLDIDKDILQTLIDAVTIANHLNPSKQYMELYQLRYVLGLKQKQIAEELNLSQGEVSKRLLELMEEIKVAFTRA